MGIHGLLPLLQEIASPININEFRGCTAAVDVYCWIHKGCYRCPEQLFRGEDTEEHINYVINRTEVLLNAGIKPILVFDGQNLPAKQKTEHERQSKRQKTRSEVDRLLAYDQREKAVKLMSKCIDVSQDMAKKVIDVCRQKNWDYIVAPYEADAQITYLVNSGIAHLAITEDSDLLVFGCNLCFFKMDHFGNGTLINCRNIRNCLGNEFDTETFRRMCILSGCDYLQNIPGIGLNKSKKFFKMTRDKNLSKLLYRVPQYLNMTKKIKVTPDYVEDFIKAEKAFKHQLVYCPIQRKLVPLNDYEGDNLSDEEKSFCGQYFNEEIAYQLAIGNIDFNDRSVIDSFCMNSNNFNSIWSVNFIKPKTIEEVKVKFDEEQSESNLKEDDLNSFEQIGIKRPLDELELESTENCKKNKSTDNVEHLISQEELLEVFADDSLSDETSAFVSKQPKNVHSRNIFKVVAEDTVQVQSRFFSSLNNSTTNNELIEANSVPKEDILKLKDELIKNGKTFQSQKSLNSSGNSNLPSEDESFESVEDQNVNVEKSEKEIETNLEEDDVTIIKTIEKPKLSGVKNIGLRKKKTSTKKNCDIRKYFTAKN